MIWNILLYYVSAKSKINYQISTQKENWTHDFTHSLYIHCIICQSKDYFLRINDWFVAWISIDCFGVDLFYHTSDPATNGEYAYLRVYSARLFLNGANHHIYWHQFIISTHSQRYTSDSIYPCNTLPLSSIKDAITSQAYTSSTFYFHTE